MVSNLIVNAISYGKGKPVHVSVDAAGDARRIMVRDEGIGIAADQKARIFERFERAVPSSNYGGLGLGLWIARQIVDAHGGTIDVDSEPGQGSTFTVTPGQRPLRPCSAMIVWAAWSSALRPFSGSTPAWAARVMASTE